MTACFDSSIRYSTRHWILSRGPVESGQGVPERLSDAVWVLQERSGDEFDSCGSDILREQLRDRASSAYGRSVPISRATVNTTNSSVMAENVLARLEPS